MRGNVGRGSLRVGRGRSLLGVGCEKRLCLILLLRGGTSPPPRTPSSLQKPGTLLPPPRMGYDFQMHQSSDVVPTYENRKTLDADGRKHNVRVVLMGSRPPADAFKARGANGISLLLAENEHQLFPIGGSWCEHRDGPAPHEDATLERTARRVTREFCGMDLTEVPLIKFLEIHLNRPHEVDEENGLEWPYVG